jgi:hypothetical protein
MFDAPTAGRRSLAFGPRGRASCEQLSPQLFVGVTIMK